jgi:uncharacterized protein (TIGR01319 family)
VRTVAVCADVGSTFTKVAAVDLQRGELVATATHPTTVDSDVLCGLDAAVAEALGLAGASASSVDVCSSAGGGLRLAVVGYETLVTAEAGHRVGLSAGARVVHVAGGPLDPGGLRALREARPDVILLVGGTDGGDTDVLRHNAARLAQARLRVPVVLAGNADAREEARTQLSTMGTSVVATENVLPRIGVLNPQPARAAIREVFLRHVIGGKGLSRGPRFASLVRGATPDIVLTAVELIADVLDGDLAVVDVGGATTDVYSVLSPDPQASPVAEVAGTMWRSRSVEGDLGLRWSAPTVVAAAVAERLCDGATLSEPAARRAADPAMLPGSDDERAADTELATIAATVALRRHARGESNVDSQRRTGRKDLSRLRLLVGSGGVLRHAPPASAERVLRTLLADRAGGWPLPTHARTVVDTRYLLAPIGLLAQQHREAAVALARQLIGSAPAASQHPGRW